MALARTSLADGPMIARSLLAHADVDALEIARPIPESLPYRSLIEALLGCQGFRLDFKGQEPDAAIDMIVDKLLGSGSYATERRMLAEEIADLKAFAAALVYGPPPLVAIRTYFAPGDLVWHLDRMAEPASFRLLWAIGRPAGMHITPGSNIDRLKFAAFMRREHALLCQLDSRVVRSRADLRDLWAHRPAQVEAMIAGEAPFVIDPQAQWAIPPASASIHRVDTPQQPGTYHRSSWANRHAPGFQIVITASGEPA